MQITLKYILFPGINDNYEDYASLIEIMKNLGVNHLAVSRNTRIKYNIFEEQNTELIETVGKLITIGTPTRSLIPEDKLP